jgi:predicted nucleic acid-binding protein
LELKLVLDTNAYSGYAEGIDYIVDILATRGEQIYLPAVVIGELQYGFLKGRRRQYNETKLGQFMELLNVQTIDINSDVARKYAVIYMALREKGTKIPINDVWIAACCMDVGGTLLTRDKHFHNVEQIDVIALE